MEPPLWVFQPPPPSAFNLGWAQVNLVMSLTALTRAAGFYPWLAALLFAFGAAMIACNTA